MKPNLGTGLREPCVCDWHVRLDLGELVRRPSAQPSHRPSKRHLHSGDVAIVVVIHAGDKASDRRIGIAHQPHEQAGLHVEAQRRYAAAGRVALNEAHFPIVEDRRHTNSPPCKAFLDPGREEQLRLEADTLELLSRDGEERHWLIRGRCRDPPAAAIEDVDGLAGSAVNDRRPLARRPREQFHRHSFPHRQSRCTCPWRSSW